MTIPTWFDIERYRPLLDEDTSSELTLYSQFKARFDIYAALQRARGLRGSVSLPIEDFLPKGIRLYWEAIKNTGIITFPKTEIDEDSEAWLVKYSEPTHPIDLASLDHLMRITEDIEMRMTNEGLAAQSSTPVHTLFDQEALSWIYFRADLDLPTKQLVESFENHVCRIKKLSRSEKASEAIKNPKDKIDKIRKYQLIPYLDLHLANQIEGESADLDFNILAATLSTEVCTLEPRDFKSGPKSKVGYLAKAVLTHRFLKDWRSSIDKRYVKEKAIPEISLTTWPR